MTDKFPDGRECVLFCLLRNLPSSYERMSSHLHDIPEGIVFPSRPNPSLQQNQSTISFFLSWYRRRGTEIPESPMYRYRHTMCRDAGQPPQYGIDIPPTDWEWEGYHAHAAHVLFCTFQVSLTHDPIAKS